MIVITGATGQLGRLVIESLLSKMPANEIVAAVRTPEKAKDLADRGIGIREADYTRPDTLDAAFAGAEKVLLISSSAVGQRVPQHRAVISAAMNARVQLMAYTSILHADISPLGLATEHRDTEALLKMSGLAHVILRNGWYSENYAGGAKKAVENGAVLGCAGAGRISSASRADYAAAAAQVLTMESQSNKVYELAGDSSYTLAELAAEIEMQSGKPVKYVDLSPAEYKAKLLGFGLPGYLADLLSDSDAGAAKGGLFGNTGHLSQLLGRATTPIGASVAAALK